ncbi:7205_t:CDS:2 [Funneliformis caledonium]|uniref:7205_t:CDS:1 n=1 Tax=Funneliformis caledonium TaxID=1117310 RepID=A0A9N9ENY1_9GLOM|nr:7205_t:CDS:2 [Funneliformis caledonium]
MNEPLCVLNIRNAKKAEIIYVKKHGKQAEEARERSNNLQNFLDAIRSFQNIIDEIRSIIRSIEAFWNYQVVNVEILVNTARECEECVEI